MVHISEVNIELEHPEYVPVNMNSAISYGGSQMWYSADNKSSKDYVIHRYGCGTIAFADLLLYLALHKPNFASPLTELALKGSDKPYYDNYRDYVYTIHDSYTKTRRILAVLGPKLGSTFNSYAKKQGLAYRGKWKLNLNSNRMLAMIQEMLHDNIPVIISIGPNTPKLWGKKGVYLYNKKSSDDFTSFEATGQSINSHYVTITAIETGKISGKIMLRISSWGKSYYIDYEDYRNYVDTAGGKFTSSILYIKHK